MTTARALVDAVRLARPFPGRVALSLLMATLSVGLAVSLIASSGYLISRAAEQPLILTLGVAIAAVRAFAIARAVARYLERLSAHEVALRVLVETRARFLRRATRLATGILPRRGDLLGRLVADVDQLQHLFLRALAPPVVAVAVSAVAVTAAWLTLPAAGLVLLAGLGSAGIAVPLLVSLVVRRADRRRGPVRLRLWRDVTELVAAAPELVTLGRGVERAEAIHQTDVRLQRLLVRDAMGASAAATVLGIASGATVVGLLAVAVPAVTEGRLRGVLLAPLVLAALASFEAVSGLGLAVRGLAATADSARRVEEPLGRAALPGGRARTPRGPLTLDIQGVEVRPSPVAGVVLHGIDLRLTPGEHVALVGPSGSGKSTLAGAIVGLLPLEEGAIRLDDRELCDLDPESVRDRIRLCDQEAYLFATTVAENVRLARPAASDAEVEGALVAVGLGPWLEALPDGIHTDVGDTGNRLSGGQRQRVALARGVLAAPDLLVLDEPTSQLDAEGARTCLGDVLAAVGVASVLVVTHRLEGLDLFDRVLVMEEGRIVEQGRLEELRRPGTRFARLEAASRLVEGVGAGS